MQYRAELDGLRALSVTFVILFHADFQLFEGGFAGVDIFFVISGYLITSILINDIENGKFSVLSFYERRARRILPALFFMMLFCIPFSFMWMMPNQMVDFSRSLVAVSWFSSNFLFWLQSGYFMPAAEQMPLLHTWSLAVEEQYYFVFPLFLLLSWKFGKRAVIWFIIILAILSFSLTEFGQRFFPVSNFYLLPTRAWELLVGSIAAFIVQRQTTSANNILAAIGLIFILSGIFIYERTTPFPSAYTLLPVTGTFLFILFCDSKTWVGRFFSVKPIAGIGLISYSAYLWHHPIFTFANYFDVDKTDLISFLALSFGITFISFFSWKYIENPFRRSNAISAKVVFLFTLFGIGMFSSIGLLGSSQILKPRGYEFSKFIQVEQAQTKHKAPCKFENPLIQEHCEIIGDVFTTPSSLIIGDSHAGSIKASIAKKLLLNSESSFFITGCSLPVKNVSMSSQFAECVKKNAFIYDDFLSEYSFKNIVVISRWSAHWHGTPFNNQEGGVEHWDLGKVKPKIQALKEGVVTEQKKNIEHNFKSSLSRLSEVSNLILIYPIPETGWDIPKKLYAKFLREPDIPANYLSTKEDVFLARNKEIIELFEELEFEHSKVEPAKLFCDKFVEKRCVTHINGRPLYYDDDHLSTFGADLLTNQILKVWR